MKIIIEMDTNTDDDLDEWNVIKESRKNIRAIENIRAEIRKHLKYDENLSDESELILRNLQLLLPESL